MRFFDEEDIRVLNAFLCVIINYSQFRQQPSGRWFPDVFKLGELALS